MSTTILRTVFQRKNLKGYIHTDFTDLVKAVVDVDRGIMAIGGELHADEERVLLDDGSTQQNVWGINLYPDKTGEEWIEFDSMINLRPRLGNRSRGIDDPVLREKIIAVVNAIIV